MSKITGLDFSSIEEPYDSNLNRVDTGVLSAAGTVDLGPIGDSDDYINRELSGEDFEDLWISSWIKSRNYKPKSQGFMIDGKLGYIECMKLYVGIGGIEGGSLHIPDETADDSFHTNFYGDSWWGCNVADLDADINNAKAYILKTGYAKFQNAAVEGDSTVGGRVATTLSAAIDASGHFADNAINTAAGTILGDFTFGASGAIQIGTYVNGVSGDIKISPAGILGRSSSGATTFSINGATGIAVLNGLVVGTNVDLGTAQDSAGVTTIVGNTVTTGYVNALNVTAQYVTASISISSPTITGGTITGGIIKTAASNKRIELNSTGNLNELAFYNAQNTLSGKFYGVGTELQGGPWLFLTAKTYINGSVLMTGDISLHGSGDNRIELRDSITGYTYIEAKTASPYNVSINRSWLPTSSNSHDLGSSTYKWRSIYLSSTVYAVNLTITGAAHFHGGTTDGNFTPSSSNTRYCGTSGAYWARVYSDAYFTKNTAWQTGWDKYDDLQIIRDLKTVKDKNKSSGYKLDASALPKEICDKGFADFGGLISFNLCVSKKIVECVDDLKKTIDILTNRLNKLENI